jgi:kynureninase
MDFFAEQGLTPETLPDSYREQVARLAARFDALDLPEDVITRDGGNVGGFLALRAPGAETIQRELAARGVLTDSRGTYLRLGPAPYLVDAQLDAAVDTLGACLR